MRQCYVNPFEKLNHSASLPWNGLHRFLPYDFTSIVLKQSTAGVGLDRRMTAWRVQNKTTNKSRVNKPQELDVPPTGAGRAEGRGTILLLVVMFQNPLLGRVIHGSSDSRTVQSWVASPRQRVNGPQLVYLGLHNPCWPALSQHHPCY